jgi:hypothetical protein
MSDLTGRTRLRSIDSPKSKHHGLLVLEVEVEVENNPYDYHTRMRSKWRDATVGDITTRPSGSADLKWVGESPSVDVG